MIKDIEWVLERLKSKNIPGSALGAADSFYFLPSPLKRGVLGSAQACHASGVTKGPRPWQISDTPKAGHCPATRSFRYRLPLSESTFVEDTAEFRNVKRCKPVSVLHRGSVNMSRGSPCRCRHGSKRKDPTLGCRRNRVFLRPFQIGNSWQRKSVGMWGPKRLAHSDVQRDSIVPASRIRPGAYQRACLMTTHCSPNDHRRVAVSPRHTFRHSTTRPK